MTRKLQKGIDLLREGDLEGATAVFEDLLAADPEMAEAYLWLGNVHLVEGDLEKAAKGFRNAHANAVGPLKTEAARQLNVVRYQQLLNVLVVKPPLRLLMIIGAVAYALAYIFLRLGITAVVGIFLHVGQGFLVFFFAWLIFVVAFYLTDRMMREDQPNPWPRRVILGVAIATIPANLVAFLAGLHGSWRLALIVLAAAFNVFSLSVGASMLLYRLGHKLSNPTRFSETPQP